MDEVYLDHHSGTRPLAASVDALLLVLRQHWGSTTSPHHKGQELIDMLQAQAASLLSSLGASPSDRLYFFASHADAIAHLFFSYYLEQIRHTGKNHLITTQIEEAAILLSLKRLEELGCHGKMLSVDREGKLPLAGLEAALNPRTSLLSLAWASGLTGVVQPIAEIVQMCQRRAVAVHVDASHAIGKIPFSFQESGIDFLTFEGSLLHAPKGTAGLLIKEKTALSAPLSVTTGIHVGGIAALATALRTVEEKADHMQLETARLRNRLERKIEEGYPGALVLFKQQERLPNCTTIAFPGVMSDALLFVLNRKHIYASLGGGHCQKLSHLLIASHVDPLMAQSALSFSLSWETTEAQIEQAATLIIDSALSLQRLSHHLMESLG